MTTEVLNGTAPAFTSESDPAAAQNNAATTDAQTGGANGGEESQVTPKSYSEEELQDRIERATAKAAAKAERRAFREAAARLGAQPAQPQQHSQQSDGRPSRAQFGNEEAYFDALTDWKLDQRDRQAGQVRQQEQQRSLAQKTEDIYAKAEKLPGFDRDAFDELPLTKSIVEALVDSDVPDKLMHYMAANPAEVERIAKLSPARQAAELGKLEAKAAEAKPPARSNAPTALGGVKGKTASTGGMPDPSDTKAYMRWANEAERAGRL